MVESRIEFDWHALEEFLPFEGQASVAEIPDSPVHIKKKLPLVETSTCVCTGGCAGDDTASNSTDASIVEGSDQLIGDSAGEDTDSNSISASLVARSDQPNLSITFQLKHGMPSSLKLPSWMWCSAMASIVESLFGIPAHAQCLLLRGWPLVVHSDMTLEEAGIMDNDVLTVVFRQLDLSGLWMCSAGPCGFDGNFFSFHGSGRDGGCRVIIMGATSDCSAPVVHEDATCDVTGSRIVMQTRSADRTGSVRWSGEMSGGDCSMISGWATAQNLANVAVSNYEQSHATLGGCPRGMCRFELVRL